MNCVNSGLSSPYFAYRAALVSGAIAFAPMKGSPGIICISTKVTAMSTKIVMNAYTIRFRMYETCFGKQDQHLLFLRRRAAK